MLLWIRDRDRGSSFVEYAGVVLVVAALVGVVAFSGVADGAGRTVADGIREAFGGAASESPVDNASNGGDDSEDDGGGDDGDGGEDDGDGDDGCGWNPICHGGNVVDAASDGLSTAWDWSYEQGADFLSTGGDALWGMVTGLGDLAEDPIGSFQEWGGGLINDIKEDPTRLIVSEETRELIGDGRYGAALAVGAVDFFGKKVPGVNRGGSSDRGGDNDNGNNNENDDNGNNNKDEESENNDNCRRGSSFVPGTEVLMADGDRVPIETVSTGDEVWAFDPATGEEGPREVTDLIDSAGEKSLVDVEVTDADGETNSVTATDEHPFWAPQAGEWVDAVDLEPGTWVRSSDGSWGQVSATDVSTVGNQQVHNLTVEGLSTYYVAVGGTTTLVHNQNNDNCRMTNSEARKVANELGYNELKGRRSHGQPVFENKKGKPRYITPDADRHSGGDFKGANSIDDLGSKKTRSGTYKVTRDEDGNPSVEWHAD